MKKFAGLLLASGFFMAGFVTATAQQSPQTGVHNPPKVLVVMREFVKPGKGSAHEKTESLFIQAFARAKWPTYYLGMEAVSGMPRALFLTGYDSFEAWEKDNLAVEKNKALLSALEYASAADGEQLSSLDTGAFVYHEEMSLWNSSINMPMERYFEVSRFKVKPGHDKEWEELVKIYKNGYAKVTPPTYWAMYQSVYGAENGGVWVVYTPMKSATEIDAEFGQGKAFEAALGEAGMKRLSELTASCIEDFQTNLFHFNPKFSYLSDDWKNADPSFWKSE